MQKGIIKVTSSVLAIWYLLCVVGFDVHTCNHSGKSVVASLVAGISCEDMHPECCSDSCRTLHEHDIADKPCCTDDIRVLALTGGDREESESHWHHHDCGCSCGHCPILADIPVVSDICAVVQQDVAFPDLCHRHIFSDNIFSVFSVWRI